MRLPEIASEKHTHTTNACGCLKEELSDEFAPSMRTSCGCLKLQVKNTHIPPMLAGV